MRVRLIPLVLVATFLLIPPAAAQNTDYDVWLNNVSLRPGVSVDMYVRVFVNEKHPCHDKTIVALHGAWGGWGVWEGLAEELFADNPTGQKVCRVASIALPGHPGLPFLGSSLPTGGLLFGELTMDDYVTAYLATLERLPRYGVHTKTLLGHSMGGLVLQMAQQRLADQGTNLRRKFNAKKVLLLGPVPPAAVQYSASDQISGLFFMFHSCFTGPGGVIADPANCGWLDAEGDNDIDFADLNWFIGPAVWDCDPLTTPVGIPPLPAAQACDSTLGLGDFSIYAPGAEPFRESMTALFEFLGVLQYQRPDVDAGVFRRASKTKLWVVSFEHDDLKDSPVYEYLTGDSSLAGDLLVTGPFAVHDMPWLFPREFLDAIAGVIKLP